MTIQNVLRRISIFQTLSDEELARVAQHARDKCIKSKTVIYHEGSEREEVFILLEGLIKTYQVDQEGDEQVVSLLQSGDLFPHTSFFSLGPHSETAITLADSHLVIMPMRVFRQLILDMPTLSIELIDYMGMKIRELELRLRQVSGHDVNRRIIAFLVQLAEKMGVRQGDHIRIKCHITHQELASTIGSARESVNRLLNQLKKNKIIEMSRSEIIILDMQALMDWG